MVVLEDVVLAYEFLLEGSYSRAKGVLEDIIEAERDSLLDEEEFVKELEGKE